MIIKGDGSDSITMKHITVIIFIHAIVINYAIMITQGNNTECRYRSILI